MAIVFNFDVHSSDAIRQEFKETGINLNPNMIYNLTNTPPINSVTSVRIDSNGIYYNGTKKEEKLLILATNQDEKSRGLSFNITSMDDWIDVAAECMKENLKIISLTY